MVLRSKIAKITKRDLIKSEIEKLFFEAGIVHNDLQYHDVLWDGNKFWIIDFGMAKNL